MNRDIVKVSPADIDFGQTSVGSDKPPTSAKTFVSFEPAGRRWYIFYEGDRCRTAWQFVLGVLLVYTGTLLPYRICFEMFRIGTPYEPSLEWIVIDWIEYILWCVDLVINFLFSYTAEGAEVDDLRRIARRYLCGYFPINFIACFPEQAVEAMVLGAGGTSESGTGAVNRLSRLLRLQRLTRLMRLLRMGDVSRLIDVLRARPGWKWLFQARIVRLLNFITGLIWVTHMLSCGWYLTAALHSDPEDTWVMRRTVDAAGTLLVDKAPVEQWLQSMYFVLTVFTTVGFGDMSADTTAEILTVCFIMVLGSIVHSVLLGEMMNVITSIDAEHMEFVKRRDAIEGFARHAGFCEDMGLRTDLREWVHTRYRKRAMNWHHDFDREVMREMLMDGSNTRIPQPLVERIPELLFGGKLMQNRLVIACTRRLKKTPSRLPVLMALHSDVMHFGKGDIVYQIHEHAMNVFLVMSGIFSHVGRPTAEGGVDDGPKKGAFDLDGALGLFLRTSATPPPAISSATSTSAAALHRTRTQEIHLSHLFPYDLLCTNSFFGAAEVIGCTARYSTVRCEEDGVALVLHKKDLARIHEEFPHFHSVMTDESTRVDFKRRCCLQQLRQKGSHEDLAARRIQTAWRDVRRHSQALIRPSSNLRAAAGCEDGTVKANPESSSPPAAATRRLSVPESQAASEAAALRGVKNELRRELREGLAELRSELKRELCAEVRRELRGGLEARASREQQEQQQQQEQQPNASAPATATSAAAFEPSDR